mgnify:FL=1
MPMYDYKCRSCSELFEELVLSSSVSDEEITCPNCGKNKAVKQLSAPAVAVGSSFEPACERTGCSTPVQSGFG